MSNGVFFSNIYIHIYKETEMCRGLPFWKPILYICLCTETGLIFKKLPALYLSYFMPLAIELLVYFFVINNK